MKDLYVAVACSSNMNRSMEAHAYLSKKGFNVKSYGTGDLVRLPGLTPQSPNNYEFGTPYTQMYNDLVSKDKQFYTQNGVLNLLNRNRRIKPCPERLQDSNEKFDVIITCDERVFDEVIKMFTTRDPVGDKEVHVINVEIEDNEEDATIGAILIADIVSKMTMSDDLNRNIDAILHFFELKYGKDILNVTMQY